MLIALRKQPAGGWYYQITKDSSVLVRSRTMESKSDLMADLRSLWLMMKNTFSDVELAKAVKEVG